MTRYKYTLGFVYCPETDQVLLLNRQKAPWMGRWNGIGGKLEPTESPHECIVREAEEETGLIITQWQDRGVLRWFRDDNDLGGVHLFTAEVRKDELEAYKTPKCYCHEGILDWKKLDWILHDENTGVVDNVKVIFNHLFEAGPQWVFVATYDKLQLASCTFTTGEIDT